jgi:transcriptional regulator with XRE-family HTH domain
LEGLIKGRPVREVARETDISETAIRSYLNRGVIPSADKAARLASYFKVDLEWFITGEASSRGVPMNIDADNGRESDLAQAKNAQCEQCDSLRIELDEERKMAREMVRENREINEENRRLWKEVSELRVKQAETKAVADVEIKQAAPNGDTSQCA